MNKEIHIPDFLKHLPVYRGYPVPYFVPQDENGVYLLKYGSREKMDSCIIHHKCCVCFKPLIKGVYFFISGPMGLQTQTDSHPPMHIHQCTRSVLNIHWTYAHTCFLKKRIEPLMRNTRQRFKS